MINPGLILLLVFFSVIFTMELFIGDSVNRRYLKWFNPGYTIEMYKLGSRPHFDDYELNQVYKILERKGQYLLVQSTNSNFLEELDLLDEFKRWDKITLKGYSGVILKEWEF